MKLEELVETSVMCKEKQHENERLDYYCQNCKVCICDKCGQTRHTHHTKVDVVQAADEQKLELEELVQEMKLEIADYEIQVEKTTEFLRKSREKIVAARNNVLTTVEELIRVLKEHEIAMDTKLDVIEGQQQRDHATQLEHFQLYSMQLKTSVEYCEAIIRRNNSVEILESQQRVIERCKGILNVTKMNIYKPLNVRYKINEEGVLSVRRAFLGEVFVSTLTDPLQSVAKGKGLKEAEAGREASLTITTKDSEGKRCHNETDEIVVKVRSPSEEILDNKVEDKGNGFYRVTYTTDCEGRHDVVIKINGQPLTSSPWSVHVTPHQYQAVASFGSRGIARGEFSFPCDIAISDKTGNIAVADSRNERVQLFSSDGVHLTEFGQKGPAANNLKRPISVAFNKSGDVTIIDDFHHIFCFTESGKLITNISIDHLIQTNDMHIAIDGRMVVCDCGDKTVKVLSPDGTELLQSVRAPDCDASPCSALYHQDMFYVSYELAHCVKVFNSEGVYLYDIGTEGSAKLYRPAGLAVDKFNNLIVCDTGNSRVQVFTLDGKFVNSILGSPASQLRKPFAVAVSTTGQLFITDIVKRSVYVFE